MKRDLTRPEFARLLKRYSGGQLLNMRRQGVDLFDVLAEVDKDREYQDRRKARKA